MNNAVLIAGIVFLAAFTHSLSGFGFALIVMPLITLVIGLRMASPLVALAGLTACAVNVLRHRQAVNLREVLRLGVASAVGIPVGTWALANVDESAIKALMGLILIAYALFALVRPTAAGRCSPRWVYAVGFVAGCLGGAYNTSGPPVIVYGSLRQWPKEKFRAVLQAFFSLNAALVVASHCVAHNLTADVASYYLYAAPAILLGSWLGSRVDGKLHTDRFRTLVMVMILALGLSLVL